MAAVLAFFFIGTFTIKNKERSFREKGYEPGKLLPDGTPIISLDSLIQDTTFVVRNGITCFSNINKPFNSFGFRSPEFATKFQRGNDKLCIGLIGDSFTYGSSANPIDSCFADRLRGTTDFQIDNLGIPGAGLSEYFNIVNWYVPSFQPELIFVTLTHGDLIKYLKEYNYSYPFQYATNVGLLPAYDEIGRFKFKSARESYDYYLEHYTLERNKSLLVKWVSKSAFETRLWKKYFWPHLDTLYQRRELIPKSWVYLDKIDSVCRQYNVAWRIVVIPHRDDPVSNKQEFLNKNRGHFGTHDFLLVNLVKNDYTKGVDTHINNSGHDKIRKLIQEKIQEYTDNLK